MTSKNIFITGGAGYVGSVLVPKLLDKGYSVTVLDLMIYGEEVLPKHERLNAVKGDIRDQALLKKLLPGHDAVIHLACISNDPSFELNPGSGQEHQPRCLRTAGAYQQGERCGTLHLCE
jgi:nucleoside-diphosphate-sugar epimerase